MAVNYYIFQFPALANVNCVFQRRTEPCSNDASLAGNISFQVGCNEEEVINTRKELFTELTNMGLLKWCECSQVHGNDILIDAQPTPLEARKENLRKADGMTTAATGLGLMIKTADCQPVLLAHNSGRFVMALHVGWRGNRNNFIGKAVELFCENYNISPADILAVRGPSLGPAKAEFVNFKSEWGDDFKHWYDSKSHCMDLWSLTRSQLNASGIPNNSIYEIDICTASNFRDFFSYRHDHHTGRQASLIWINNP